MSAFVSAGQGRVFSWRTVHAMRFDLLRLDARSRQADDPADAPDQLHLGSGTRSVPGWLNTDVVGSDRNVDLAGGSLPWPSDRFRVVVSQHVIEHLSLHGELLPLLKELERVLQPGGEIWLSCPDMEKLCRAYCEGRVDELLAKTLSKTHSDLGMKGVPAQHYINVVFDQDGEHKNLFDFELLRWALEKSGFVDCRKVDEAELLRRFPGFPPRDDDYHTLYVTAIKPPKPTSR